MTTPPLAAFALIALAAPGLGGLAAPGAALAQSDTSVMPRQSRYAFAPVPGGALKLDTQTGQVSLCTTGATGFACIAVPDTRDAYEAEIARLQDEIATLKQGAAADQARPPAPPPAVSDLDTALSYAERFYRRFKQMIDDFRAPDPSEKL
ncbi:hypothetical protein V5F53_16340 [Xanthobacter sp. V4C-4]|uniref:hypothetical protein n=1 Tax=Xanthobacter cornucopiae TaxID=3119924 RepID=UPI00372C6668